MQGMCNNLFRLGLPLTASSVLVLGSLLTSSLAVAQSASTTESSEGPAVLQKVVISAAGYEQKITDAPASISVISSDELKERPYSSLLDAVRDLEGVDIGETRDKTGQGTISMRGMGADYTLILINGRRVNNHGDIYPNSFGGNQFNHIPPLDSVERIEVIRGPAATLYGADALGGVINIITRKDLDKWTGSATVGYTAQENSAFGDGSTIDLYASGPLIPGKLSASLRGSFYDQEGSNPSYSTVTDPTGEVINRNLGFGGGGKTVDNEDTAAGFSLIWTPTKNQSLTLDYDLSNQEYDNSTKINDAGVEEYPVGTVDDFGSMLRVTNGRLEPRAGYSAEQEFTRETWSLAHEGKWDIGNSFISLAYVETDNNGRTLPYTVDERHGLQNLWNTACATAGGTITTPGGTVVGDRCTVPNSKFNNNWSQTRKLDFMSSNLSADEYADLLSYLPRPKRTLESNQFTLDARLDKPFEYAGQQHLAVVGGQVIRGELKDGVFGMESGAPGAVQEHNTWSIFVEDTWYVTQPLAITAGTRYDNHNVFGGQNSPRLYAVYTMNDQFTLKGGVTTGYKAPKTTQLFDGIVGFGGQGVSPQYGNPNLKPETSVSTELALYWQHPTAGHNFNVTLFQNDFKDKIATGQPCGGIGQQSCSVAGDFAELGYADGSTRTGNVDKVELHGVEVAGRWQILQNLALKANYTYTDSKMDQPVTLCTEISLPCNNSAPKETLVREVPFNNIAKHMTNATLDWQATNKLKVFLNLELRSKRYREMHQWSDLWVDNVGYDGEFFGKEQYFKSYDLLNLGASYSVTNNLTVHARVNNLADRSFTSYHTDFYDRNNNGTYESTDTTEALFMDDYNNKESRRNFWVSASYRF